VADLPDTMQELRSTVTRGGELVLEIVDVAVPRPAPDEVLVRIDAAPINPSDLALLFGFADMTTAEALGTPEAPRVSATVPPALLPAVAARFDESLPVGNEAGGVVVAAGSDPAAQALMGRTVGCLGGAMYTQYRALKLPQVLALPDGTTPEQGASCFVNPLTALCMTETMRREGHSALLHTAAASNLGQMLQRICTSDGIDLVNIVRRAEHVELLREQGAKYVCNASDDDFMEQLTAALTETRATIAFDATGGGTLASRIFTAMEAAANANATSYNRYGSDVFKQVYIYGGLDRSPTTLSRNFGFAWSLSGWLLTPFLQKIGPEATEALRQRIAREITTTFASHYSARVSLAGALSLNAIGVYGQQATGQKYLINPNA